MTAAVPDRACRERLSVCLVCDEYPPWQHGGIGTATQLLARALVRVGHAVRIVGAYAGGDGTSRTDESGVEVVRLRRSTGRLGWLADRRALYSTVAGWARAGVIDLVEVPDFAGWAAGWPRLPVPVVARLHGSLTYFAAESGLPARRTTALLERASLRRADAVVSCSTYTAGATGRSLRLPSLSATVVHNFVDECDVAAGRRNADDVVFTGSLTPRKGVRSLCLAWPLVLERRPSARLHIFGKDGHSSTDGSMRAEMERLFAHAPRAGVSDSVCFHGHSPRATVLAALARARVAVFPSFVESFALAPLEAMAVGCPTIYTRRGSGAELVEDGVSGLLVEPHRPDEIASAIVRVLEDDALAERLGRNGRRHVQDAFSAAVLLPRNVALYRRTVEGFAGRPAAPTRHAS